LPRTLSRTSDALLVCSSIPLAALTTTGVRNDVRAQLLDDTAHHMGRAHGDEHLAVNCRIFQGCCDPKLWRQC
jgi:hypothetical protein